MLALSDAETTGRFIDALHVLERNRNVEAITALFVESSDIGNVASRHEYLGSDGARAFWESYRSWFGTIESTFRNVIVDEGRAALEWTTTGASAAGDPISYDGVSILEIADGKITRFRAYFDPGALGEQMEPALAGHS